MNKIICYLTLFLPRLHGWSIIKAWQKERKGHSKNFFFLHKQSSPAVLRMQNRNTSRGTVREAGTAFLPGLGPVTRPVEWKCLTVDTLNPQLSQRQDLRQEESSMINDYKILHWRNTVRIQLQPFKNTLYINQNLTQEKFRILNFQ